jgi:oligopeptide transport system substrate-binding protein
MRRMKKIVAMLLAMAMLVCVFTGCGGTKTNNEGSGKGEAAADKDAYINCLLKSEPSTLDVGKFMNIYDRTVLWNVLEPLTRVQDGQVVAAGAEKWEVSNDGLTYTFHLRDNTWSDGKKVTAADYAYGIKREADPKNAWSLASDMFSIKNFQAIYNGQKDLSELGVEAKDDSTLIINMDSMDVALLSNVDFFPCRQDIAEKNGDQYGSELNTMVFCGPYVCTEWVHGSTMKFVKNDKYWDKDNVKLANYTFNIITDVNAIMSSFEAGSLDYVSVSNSEYIKKFSADTKYNKKTVSEARTYMAVFNCKDSVFSNVKIRQAFSLALDRESLVDVMTGNTATPAYGLIPVDSSVGKYNYRKEVEEPLKALSKENSDPKALLIEGMKEAGLGEDPSKLSVKFSWGGTNADAHTFAELYKQMWESALGVTVELEFNDTTTHMTNINSGKYQIATTGWGANVEPKFQISRWANKKGGQSMWVNADYVAAANKASSSLDDKARLDAYAEAEKLLISEAAIAPIYYVGSERFSYSYVQGLSDCPFDTTGMKLVYTSGRK